MCPLIFWQMPYVCAFKGDCTIQLCICGNKVAIVLQGKSIQLFRVAATGPNLSLTTDHMCLSCFLDFDCVCCFCQLSICVGSSSLCRT